MVGVLPIRIVKSNVSSIGPFVMRQRETEEEKSVPIYLETRISFMLLHTSAGRNVYIP